MKPLTQFQIRLNLIDMVANYIREEYADHDEDEGQERLLRLLRIYRGDTVRLMEGRIASLGYLFNELKYGVRLAASLMEEIQEHEGQSLIGWYHGKPPSNTVQFFYNLLSATVLELTKSIVEIEEQYPAHKGLFDEERAEYATLREHFPSFAAIEQACAAELINWSTLNLGSPCTGYWNPRCTRRRLCGVCSDSA